MLSVLCCFALIDVCLTLLASFFLPSHPSLKHIYMYMCIPVHIVEEKSVKLYMYTYTLCVHAVLFICYGIGKTESISLGGRIT